MVGKDRDTRAGDGCRRLEFLHGGHVDKVDGGRVMDSLLRAGGVELARGVVPVLEKTAVSL